MSKHQENGPIGASAPPRTDGCARILLVSGDENAQQVLLGELRGAGHHVVTTESGSSALVLFAVARIDIVFAAHELPDMTGQQLLASLRLASPLTPVILTAAPGDTSLALSLMRSGAMDVISRSSGSKEIHSVLRRALGNIDARCRLSEETLMRRDAMVQVEQNEARLRAVLASTSDPLITINCKGIIESASDSVERDFGWKPAELLGHNISILIPQPHHELHSGYLEQYLATDKTYILGRSRELEAVRKDGTIFPCEITVWQSDMPGRSTPIFTGILRDITERKKAEETLRKYALDLEAANEAQEREAARISTLAEELSIARERAEQAADAKSEFLANMSHEIRTPMTAILGFAENLLDSDLSDNERFDTVQTIQRNGQHLLSIINDILDLSKIEAAKLSLERMTCSLVQIVSDVISLMRPQAKDKKLKVSLQFDGPVPATIHTDPTRLRQILVNLVGNAIKFTKSGSIKLVVKMQEAAAHGNPLIEFHVTDSGIGVSPEQLAKLFEPFSQADASTTRLFGGTGLGLVISKRLARVLGGELTVRSELGQGSTFSVTLDPGPIDNIEMITETSEAVAGPPATVNPTCPIITLPGKRILLAEDGVDNQRLISFILKKTGVEVKIVANGDLASREALSAAAEGKPFDVILMDMQMPVMDGYEATRHLREQEYHGPIIALTAHAMSGDRDRCLAAGCDDYATKPIQRDIFLTMVESYASQNATQHASKDETTEVAEKGSPPTV